MDLIESDAKALLREAGLPVPAGELIGPQDRVQVARLVMVKAQVPFGARGKLGLVRSAAPAQAPAVVDMVRAGIRAAGFPEPLVLLEDAVVVDQECYLAWRIDDVRQAHVLAFIRDGGAEVEARAEFADEVAFLPGRTPYAHDFVPFFARAGFSGRTLAALCRFAVVSWRVYVQADAQLLEINPLGVLRTGDLIALDAKMTLDDNARSRHLSWNALYSTQAAAARATQRERRAQADGFTYVELGGTTAVLSGGAGLGMAIVDILADEGMPAANFVDASGGSVAAIFDRLGRVVLERAADDDIEVILMYFTLSATSLASAVNGLIGLFNAVPPPKPMVVGLLTSGAAERDMTFDEARALFEGRGYRCARNLPDVIEALRALRGGIAAAQQREYLMDETRDELRIQRSGTVLRLTIDRPHRRNALTDALMLAMNDAFAQAAADESLRVIVLTGSGDKAFCAGADLTPGDTPFKPKAAQLMTPMGRLARTVRACPIPVVGRINGLCLAGGMGLFGMCDLAIAVEDARFGMPEVKIGLFPMQILTMLRDLIPPRFLNEMCMTGKPIDARTALSIGLLNRVVPAADLDGAVDALVADLLAASPIAVRRGKYAMRAIESMSFDERISFTETALVPMILTEDAREGLAAFNERRPPNWTGR